MEFFRESVVNRVDAEERQQFESIEADVELFRNAQSLTGAWTELVIVTDGTTLRNGVTYKRADGEDATDVRVRSHDLETHYRSSMHQATVRTQPSAIAMTSVQDVRYTPSEIRPERFQRLNIFKDDRVQIELVQCDVTLDAASGLVEELVSYVGDKTHPLTVIFQSRRRLEDFGVAFPQCSVRLYFREDNGRRRLRSAEINLLQVVQINDEISEEEFDVAAPAKTVIVQLNDSNQADFARKTALAMVDVRGVAKVIQASEDQRRARASTPISSRSGGVMRWLLVALNVVILSSIALFYLFRRC